MTFCRGSLSSIAPDAGLYARYSEGLARRVLVDRRAGSVHQEIVVAELAPGGRIDRHLHAFEQALYVLGGTLTLDVAGATEHLEADDYVFLDRGTAHALRNDGSADASWFEVSAPQPGSTVEDIVFVDGAGPAPAGDPPYRLGHFDADELPAPSGAIGLAGFGEANVGGAALKILLGPDTGASQFNLMVVQYAPGGFIAPHDHAFEEGFFFLTGEVEGTLEAETATLSAGDFCWSGVGSMHALTNRSDGPVRWLETQVPQPPSRYQARFIAEWERFLQE